MLLKAKVAAIEFAGDTVRVAVFKTGGGMPKLLELAEREAAYETPEARPEALARALDEALSALESRPATYVLCVSTEFCLMRAITIPFRGRRRVAAAVRFELEPHLAFPIEELLLDFNITAEFDGETDVFAVGMRRAHLEEQQAILEAAGVNAEGVTVDAIGITGLWLAGGTRAKGLSAVLHVREHAASIVVLYNKRIAYCRHLPCNAAQLRESPAAVAREVQNSLRGFISKWRGDGDLDRIHVTGVDFSPEERVAFSQAVGLPVEDVMLISKITGGALALKDGARGGKYNTWESLAGAAMGVAGGPCAVDFRRAEQDLQGAVRGVVAHLMFSSCLALIVLLGWAFFYYQGALRYQAEAAIIQENIAELREEIEAMADKGLGADVDIDMFNDPSLLAILMEIGEKMPDDKVTVVDIRVSPPETQSWWIRIQGKATDSSSFNEVFANLKASKLFQVDDDPDLSLQDQMTTFAIKIYRLSEDTHETES